MFKGTRILILFLLPGWITALYSQQLSHQVLVPVAGVITTGSVNYSQTIGETAVELIGCPEFLFTQGFQQPSFKSDQITLPKGNGVDVFPNPVTDNLTVKLFGDVSRDFLIEIINITGTIVISEKLSFIDKFYFEKVISVEHLNNGLYFVRIVSSDKLISRSFKIEKM